MFCFFYPYNLAKDTKIFLLHTFILKIQQYSIFSDHHGSHLEYEHKYISYELILTWDLQSIRILYIGINHYQSYRILFFIVDFNTALKNYDALNEDMSHCFGHVPVSYIFVCYIFFQTFDSHTVLIQFNKNHLYYKANICIKYCDNSCIFLAFQVAEISHFWCSKWTCPSATCSCVNVTGCQAKFLSIWNMF